MRRLKWQGEEVQTEHVWLKVYENKEKPLWWSNYEVFLDTSPNDYTIMEAIKITYQKNVFYIANHFGIGIRKLRKGGWPDHCHFSFMDVEEVDRCRDKTLSYCYRDYEEHERNRRIWQKINFPEDFERSERLRKFSIKY